MLSSTLSDFPVFVAIGRRGTDGWIRAGRGVENAVLCSPWVLLVVVFPRLVTVVGTVCFGVLGGTSVAVLRRRGRGQYVAGIRLTWFMINVIEWSREECQGAGRDDGDEG